jgi:hypothetical protein
MKTDVYSWRLSPHLKSELEEAAHAEQKSMAELLEQIAVEWLERSRRKNGDEVERQRRLREAVLACVGTIDGGRPDRAENAKAEVRSRIAQRHGR